MTTKVFFFDDWGWPSTIVTVAIFFSFLLTDNPDGGLATALTGLAIWLVLRGLFKPRGNRVAKATAAALAAGAAASHYRPGTFLPVEAVAGTRKKNDDDWLNDNDDYLNNPLDIRSPLYHDPHSDHDLFSDDDRLASSSSDIGSSFDDHTSSFDSDSGTTINPFDD